MYLLDQISYQETNWAAAITRGRCPRYSPDDGRKINVSDKKKKRESKFRSDVLEMKRAGKSQREIAQELGIHRQTVSNFWNGR